MESTLTKDINNLYFEAVALLNCYGELEKQREGFDIIEAISTFGLECKDMLMYHDEYGHIFDEDTIRYLTTLPIANVHCQVIDGKTRKLREALLEVFISKRSPEVTTALENLKA